MDRLRKALILGFRGLRGPTIVLYASLVTAMAQGIPAHALVGETSPDGVWEEVSHRSLPGRSLLTKRIEPLAFTPFELNFSALQGVLARAPLEFTKGPGDGAILYVPMPEGGYSRFSVFESNILGPAVRALAPDAKTFSGQGLDDPTATISLDLTIFGFRAMILSANGAVFIDPHRFGDTKRYMSYRKSDMPIPADDFRCGVSGEPFDYKSLQKALPSGSTLRTYRFVFTITGEYFQHWGDLASAEAQTITTFNRVNGIYRREVAVNFSYDFLIYSDDPDTDPYPTGSTVNGDLLDQNQSVTDATVGSDNYDIGHILSQGGSGGLASLNAVCDDSKKARGGTSRNDPSGDPFDVDYVAHEVGHQMGGHHTFNGTTGSCGGGNREPGAAFEPGSGTTIQAYAGICGAENVQANSDPYFHYHSLLEITNWRDGGGACGSVVNTGNTPPSVDAGSDYTIPRATPFTLTATGSDADGDALTYCWEQYNLGDASPPPNNGNGPLFRSRPPMTSPSRTLPIYSDILSGAATPWEILPTVDRTINFRCVARDNRFGGGGANVDGMIINVSGEPFYLTYPNGGEALKAGCVTTVTWNVGGSTATHVNILFSSDGGNNFTLLLANTPNDGSADVLMCTETNDARLRIEPVGNIYFDISNGDFSIQAEDPSISVSATGGSVDENCEFLVTFGATVTDDCSVDDEDVDVTVSLFAGTASLAAPTISIVQTNTSTVTVTGSVLVSDLMGSPATVRVVVDAEDACGNSTTRSATADVADTIPPVIVCPEEVGIEFISPVEAVLTFEVTATDNCDVSPDITCSSESGEVFVIGSHEVGCVAEDDSGNRDSCSFDFVLFHFDIKPRSCPNPLNTKKVGEGGLFSAAANPAGADGVLPVAILGTAEFDVSQVDAPTLRLEGVPPMRWNLQDVSTPVEIDTSETCFCTTEGADGQLDLSLVFDAQDVATALGPVANGEEVILTITGKLLDGTPIGGGDCVIIRARKSGPSYFSPHDIVAAGTEGDLEFALSNHPNPFNASTTIRYVIDEPGEVMLTIYNILGNPIANLASGYHDRGEYSVIWDGREESGRIAASGMYFYRLQAGERILTRKMTLLK